MTTVAKLVELIRRTSSDLPDDAEASLKKALRAEAKGSPARAVIETILQNCRLARKNGTPMCQDTGTLTFFVGGALRRKVTRAAIGKAVAEATARGYLRRNTIDSVTGASVDSNVCDGAPVIHYLEGGGREVSLIMKGGGSENMSRQYSLPDASLGAGRDLDGVRRCVLDAICKAQGFGCAPGIIGVCVGGDRASGFEEAKLQLLKRLGSKDPGELGKLADRLRREANSLGIGAMGLGGKTTVLDIHIGSRPRVPASFFVTVAYLCWAARRRSAVFG